MKHVVSFLFTFYHVILSPFIVQITGQKTICRYSPTCSVYAAQQIKKHGIITGGYLSFKRVLSCHPF